ncbi:hypothetical protein KCP77_13400 [Salmonella enterica subsp. enterica]|nr:hypothetical protein KCP77_13400 [Salmonella enterica subsp. enterica]
MSANPVVMSAIITYMVTFDRLPELDRMGPVLCLHGRRITINATPPILTPVNLSRRWDDDAARRDTACTR